MCPTPGENAVLGAASSCGADGAVWCRYGCRGRCGCAPAGNDKEHFASASFRTEAVCATIHGDTTFPACSQPQVAEGSFGTMKRWLWWLLVLVAALPGALVLFLWVTGFDANPYAASTPQWLFYVPLLTPLLMVGGIYGAGWIVSRFGGGRRGRLGAGAGEPGRGCAGGVGGLWRGPGCDLPGAARS